ncbi:MAG: hypothetical protein AAF662_06850 [Pseudomonadota bacterium]
MTDLDYSKLGPLASVAFAISCLAVLFGTTLFHAVGRKKNWAIAAGGLSDFWIKIPVKTVAIACMGLGMGFITRHNFYIAFFIATACSAIIYFYIPKVIRFNSAHVYRLRNDKLLIIGDEKNLKEHAKQALNHARNARENPDPSMDVKKLMRGYGTPPNTPSNLWSEEYLADIKSKLASQVSNVLLLCVLTLFFSALGIEKSGLYEFTPNADLEVSSAL